MPYAYVHVTRRLNAGQTSKVPSRAARAQKGYREKRRLPAWGKGQGFSCASRVRTGRQSVPAYGHEPPRRLGPGRRAAERRASFCLVRWVGCSGARTPCAARHPGPAPRKLGGGHRWGLLRNDGARARPAFFRFGDVVARARPVRAGLVRRWIRAWIACSRGRVPRSARRPLRRSCFPTAPRSAFPGFPSRLQQVPAMTDTNFVLDAVRYVMLFSKKESARANRRARLPLTALLWASLYRRGPARGQFKCLVEARPPPTPDRPRGRPLCPREPDRRLSFARAACEPPPKPRGRSLRYRAAPARPSRSLATLGQPSLTRPPEAATSQGGHARPCHPWTKMPPIPGRRWSLRFHTRQPRRVRLLGSDQPNSPNRQTDGPQLGANFYVMLHSHVQVESDTRRTQICDWAYPYLRHRAYSNLRHFSAKCTQICDTPYRIEVLDPKEVRGKGLRLAAEPCFQCRAFARLLLPTGSAALEGARLRHAPARHGHHPGLHRPPRPRFRLCTRSAIRRCSEDALTSS